MNDLDHRVRFQPTTRATAKATTTAKTAEAILTFFFDFDDAKALNAFVEYPLKLLLRPLELLIRAIVVAALALFLCSTVLNISSVFNCADLLRYDWSSVA